MKKTTSRVFAAVGAVAVLMAASSEMRAASINYGNLNAGPAVFLNVTESSGTDPVPLFGPPSPFQVGLDFDPSSFVASSAGGGADVTDGQLNFTAMDRPGDGVFGIAAIVLREGGDYTLAGTGSASSIVLAGASLTIRVLEIDNAPVVPFTVNANASLSLDLVNNAGIVKPWGLSASVNLSAALSARQIDHRIGVTKASVVVDDMLGAVSEPASISFIAKKRFDIELIPEDVIPEPTSVALFGLALCGWAATRNRN